MEQVLPEIHEGEHVLDGGADPASVVAVRLPDWMDEPIALQPGEGELVGTNVVKAARSELSLIEFEVKPGGGVAPHFHKNHSDSFYVLEGELEFHVGDEVIRGTPGTYVLAPPNVVHHFKNVNNERAKLLNLHTPGGFVEYRRELLALHEEGVEPDDAFFESHDVFDV
ncbi:MAG: cupin domain-containing protein [Gaiellaceae bacterium]